jgi:hypothetical protein
MGRKPKFNLENYYRFRNLIVLLQFHNSLVFILLLFYIILGNFIDSIFAYEEFINLLPGESTILSD